MAVDVVVLMNPAGLFQANRENMSDTRSMSCTGFMFDFEEEEPVREPPKVPEPPTNHLDVSLERLATLLNVSVGDFATRLRWDVQSFKRTLTRSNGMVDTLLLATRLSSAGYNVTIRTAIGGGDACFRNLHHEFLCVKGISDGEGIDFIVEPSFRCNFQVPRPTPQYSELVSSVPDEFVGPSYALVPIVKFLCAEMAKSFKTTGDALPPWRRESSVMSKWLPAKSKDQPAGQREEEASTQLEGAPEELFSKPGSLTEWKSGPSKSLLSEGLMSRPFPAVPAVPAPRLAFHNQPVIYKVKSGFLPAR